MNNFQQRLIFGSLGAAGMITALIVSPWTFLACILLFSVVIQNEFFNLTRIGNTSLSRTLVRIMNATFLILVFCCYYFKFDAEYLLLSVLFLPLILLAELFSSSVNPVKNISESIFSLIYIVIPFALFIAMSFTNDNYTYEIPIVIFMLIWAFDSGAYFVGRFLGKTPLFPRISPKKTVEGLLGGIGMGLLIAYGLSHIFHFWSLNELFILSIITSLMGNLGDLVESMIKRTMKAKDSGQFLPGHGGLLDRFDSFLLIMPFVFVYLQFV